MSSHPSPNHLLSFLTFWQCLPSRYLTDRGIFMWMWVCDFRMGIRLTRLDVVVLSPLNGIWLYSRVIAEKVARVVPGSFPGVHVTRFSSKVGLFGIGT